MDLRTEMNERAKNKTYSEYTRTASKERRPTYTHTHLGVLDPGGAPGALLSTLLEYHPVHQLAVVDRTAELLADLHASHGGFTTVIRYFMV